MPQEYVSEELTHLIGRSLASQDEQFKLLVHILRSRWLQASYRMEFGAGSYLRGDSSKQLSSNEAVRAATVCFCDIPVPSLDIHMRKYSQFGLAFSKRYLVRRGVSPVFYVAANAAPPPTPGIGPRSLGATFDELYKDLYTVMNQMNELVNQMSGRAGQRVTFKLSPPGTPLQLQVLGKLNAFAGDLDKLLFAHLKFFDGTLPEEHIDNYYMEREWRKIDGLSFQWENITAVILPKRFVRLLREHLPEFQWPIRTVREDGIIDK